MPMIDRINGADTVDDLIRTSSCNEGRNLYFSYNRLGMLYFEYHVTEREVTLMKMRLWNDINPEYT